MATPVITVSFTADVQCGGSPLTVQFTDTTEVTDGFARYWFWEFGDGSISTDQNPTHIYTGTGGESFTVRLAVVATTLEFQSLSYSDKNATFVGGTYISGASTVDELTAWDNRASYDPGTTTISSHQLTVIGSGYSYSTRANSILYRTSFNNALYLLVLHVSNLTNIQGTFNSSPGGSLAPSTYTATEADRIEVGRLLGLTTTTPLEASTDVTPVTFFGVSPGNASYGLSAQPFTRSYKSHSTQSFDDHAEADFISLASLPVAGFTAIPTAGANPLSVQFTNTTIQSNCGPASTYSWKKRIHGSEDSFVEFSTEENPTEIFTK